MEALNQAQFEERIMRQPHYEGMPVCYTVGDFDSNGARVIRWYPALSDRKTRLKILAVQKVDELSADADEPIIPIEDRIVLYYGGLALAWERERNESEANRAWNAFYTKRDQMAAKSGDAPQVTEMRTSEDYLRNKRYRRFARRGYRNFTRD